MKFLALDVVTLHSFHIIILVSTITSCESIFLKLNYTIMKFNPSCLNPISLWPIVSNSKLCFSMDVLKKAIIAFKIPIAIPMDGIVEA